jgi:small subunit ribosomal protein S17
MPKRVSTGVVTSSKMNKTLVVEIRRMVMDKKYKKYVRSRSKCYVHDENNEAGVGDKVEIIESRPLSRLKRWALVRIVEKSTAVDVAALKEVRRHQKEEHKEVEAHQ